MTRDIRLCSKRGLHRHFQRRTAAHPICISSARGRSAMAAVAKRPIRTEKNETEGSLPMCPECSVGRLYRSMVSGKTALFKHLVLKLCAGSSRAGGRTWYWYCSGTPEAVLTAHHSCKLVHSFPPALLPDKERRSSTTSCLFGKKESGCHSLRVT